PHVLVAFGHDAAFRSRATTRQTGSSRAKSSQGARIGHLRTVARLWQRLHATLAPPAPDLTQALTALGFEPITPAHSSTRAAYGHRCGRRHVEVSLDLFGEPGVEVDAGDAGTLVWSVTVGPEVPVAVLAAVARAATHPRHTDP